MGTNKSKFESPSNYTKQIIAEKSKYGYSNKDKFIPLFTTKTSTTVYGYVRLQCKENQINQIIPIELIDIIYLYIKNNCTFIVIFEHNTNPQQSYLHEMDVESGTNKNISIKYNCDKYNNNKTMTI